MKIPSKAKLFSYSLSAAAYLAITPEAQGQLYYNYMPDSILDNPTIGVTLHDLDLDGDGVMDLRFSIEEKGYTTGGTWVWSGEEKNIIPLNDNRVLQWLLYPVHNPIDPLFSGGAYLGPYMPSNRIWNSNTVGISRGQVVGSGSFDTWGFDGYIGMAFELDSAGSKRYGWMHLYIGGSSVVLRDYYIGPPETAISALWFSWFLPIAQYTGYTDIANTGNASDIALTFSPASDESNIDDYVVILSREISTSTFSLTDVDSAIAAGNAVLVPASGGPYVVNFPASFQTWDGVNIVNDENYRAIIVSRPDPTTTGWRTNGTPFSSNIQITLGPVSEPIPDDGDDDDMW